MTYRVGNHQPQNVYRDDQYIGVMFTAEDAALVVEALNGAIRPAAALAYETTKAIEKHLRILGYTQGSTEWDGALAAARAFAERPAPRAWTELTADEQAEAIGIVSDSCTCTKAGPDPACPVHQGRRARGPKPPPVGEGCICDGSGRTCPRHGAVI
jgi:hypothetical protein